MSNKCLIRYLCLLHLLGGVGNLSNRNGILKIANESPYCYNPNELFGSFVYRYIQNTSGTSQNLPTDIGNNNAYCLNIPGPYEQQLLYVYATGAYYSRMKMSDIISDWHRLDNFGCNTVSDLASLLGVPKRVIGHLEVIAGTLSQDYPTPGTWGIYARLGDASTDYKGHLFFEMIENGLYYQTSSGLYPENNKWKKIPLQAV